MAAVYLEALVAATRTGYHSTEEVAAAIDILPNSAADRKKLYQRLAAESHNADRTASNHSSQWDRLASSESTNPLVREMNPIPAVLILLWICNGLWLCDTLTIAGFLEEFFRRHEVEIEITQRRISDEIRRLGLYRYEGEGRLILARRGPEPNPQLRREMRVIGGEKTEPKPDVLPTNGDDAERTETELKN